MKRIAVLALAVLLAGCTSFGQLGMVCYIPPEHAGMCQLMPKLPAAPATVASGVSV